MCTMGPAHSERKPCMVLVVVPRMSITSKPCCSFGTSPSHACASNELRKILSGAHRSMTEAFDSSSAMAAHRAHAPDTPKARQRRLTRAAWPSPSDLDTPAMRRTHVPSKQRHSAA